MKRAHPFQLRAMAILAAVTTLAAGAAHGQTEVWRRAERIDLRPDGSPTALRFALTSVSISDDGRWVVFASLASDLVTGDSNGRADVFVRDRHDQTTRRLSLRPDGSQTGAASTFPTASGDARFVSFVSIDDQLVPGDGNFGRDAFLLDRDADGNGVFDEPGTAQITRVGVDGTGAQLAAGVRDLAGAVSAHGTHIAFATAQAIAGDDTNAASDVYVRDRQAAATVAISRSTDGVIGDDDSPDGFAAPIRLSDDGARIAFTSDAGNLVGGDGNAGVDLFVRDRDSDRNGVFDEPGGTTTVRASVRSDGSALGLGPFVQYDFSRDGRMLAMAAPDPGGPNPSGRSIFLRDLASGTIAPLAFVAAQWVKGPATCCRNESPLLARHAAVVAFTASQAYVLDGTTTTRGDVFVQTRDGALTRITDYPVPTSLYDGDSYEAVALSPNGAYLLAHHIKAGGSMGPNEGYYVYRREAIFAASFE